LNPQALHAWRLKPAPDGRTNSEIRALSARLGESNGCQLQRDRHLHTRDSACWVWGLPPKRSAFAYAELSAEANSMQRTYGIAAGLRYRCCRSGDAILSDAAPRARAKL
jgi:hypothetical protein